MSISPLRAEPTPFRPEFEEASTLRTDAVPFATLGPSCAGGAHRRCLLGAEQCSCPHHRGLPVAAHVAPPVEFVCPVCFEPHPTLRARSTHLRQTHPIGTSPHKGQFEVTVGRTASRNNREAPASPSATRDVVLRPVDAEPKSGTPELSMARPDPTVNGGRRSRRAELLTPHEGGRTAEPGCAPATASAGEAPGSVATVHHNPTK